MPLHHDRGAKIKNSYSQGFPKDLMEFSSKVDNKFLNDNLHTIEEMEYRQKGITDDFKNYQNKYYDDRVILNHDLYFKHENKVYARVSGAQPLNIMNTGFIGSLNNQVNGADLFTDQTGSDQSGFGGYVYIGWLDAGTIGEFYDQSAVSYISGVAGNYRHGVYDQQSSVPTNLMADSGSLTVQTGYTFEPFTEFALTVSQNYQAFQVDNNTVQYNRRLYGTAHNAYDTQAYGTFPDPSGYDVTNYTVNIVGKIGHS